MQDAFELTSPLPGRNAFASLRQQLFDYMRSRKMRPGMPFPSDLELARITGLSRNTVRKSLDPLVRDGWIERRQGTGTFVGPRALAGDDASLQTVRLNPQPGNDLVRLGVMLGFGAGDRHAWYGMEVLRGLEAASVAERVSIDLLGIAGGAVHLRRRIQQTRPDVLACLSPDQSWALMIAEARVAGIPVLVTGTRLMDIGVPTICEENVNSTKAAVKYLFERGHRKIAFVQDAVPAKWSLDRFHGYTTAMTELGLDCDSGLSLWVRQERGVPDDGRLARFLARKAATAVILGSAGLSRFFGPALLATGLRVPEDLSVITFDQVGRDTLWLPGRAVTSVNLPLGQIGQEIARHARRIADGKPLPELTILPCALQKGVTVQPLKIK